MPTDTSKRVRTESSRKRQGRENEEAIQREATAKKTGTKARKDRRDEAKEDDLLVEREGEPEEIRELRALNRRLASDLERMHAHQTRHESTPKPRKMIPEPDSVVHSNIKKLRKHLGWAGDLYNSEWFDLRGDAREILNMGGLDRNKRWAKQDLARRGTIVLALEKRHTQLQDFENHWGALYLLQECWNNLLNYRHRRHGSRSSDDPGDDSGDDSQPPSPPNNTQLADTDDEDTRKHKAKLRKAAMLRAVERKAANLKATAELEAVQADNSGDAANDGETEPEELPEEVRRAIEEEEIGVPADSDAPLKPVPKQKRRRVDEDNLPNKSIRATHKKQQSVVYTKRGGKRVLGSCRVSRTATPIPDDGVSVSSGQTSSDSDDD